MMRNRDRVGRGRGGMAKRVVLAGLLALMLPFGAATAKPPLREVPEIVDTLFIVAVANEVAKLCPTITPRRLKGLSILLNLRAHANKLGYSDDEIRAQIESKEEKAWMRAKGEAYLKSRGVVIGEPETYCVFGREEIKNSSAIGALLKAR